MELNRREFGRLSSLSMASLFLGSWMSCEKSNDLITSLRAILQSVEKALAALSLLSGLLPDAVNIAAEYLMKVCKFVDSVSQILESETIAAADKARQILELAGGLVIPTLPQSIAPIIGAVVSTVNHFLSFFGTDIDHAAVAARGRMNNVPKMEFDAKQLAQLRAIEKDAVKDEALVEDWQKKALVVPAKK